MESFALCCLLVKVGNGIHADLKASTLDPQVEDYYNVTGNLQAVVSGDSR